MTKGQLGLAQEIVMGIVVIGVMIVVGFKITDGLSTGETASGKIMNATTDVDEAFTEISDNLSLVATIGIFTIVLGLVMVMRRQ